MPFNLPFTEHRNQVENLMPGAGVREVQLRTVQEPGACPDLTLEEDILRQAQEESAQVDGVNSADGHDAANLLSGLDEGGLQRQRHVHVPVVDALDARLQALSSEAVAAAQGDEQALRLALLKCGASDSRGIADFCSALQQVLDVTGGTSKLEAAMKLVAGQDVATIIRAHSFSLDQ